jgi:hypothetical protein
MRSFLFHPLVFYPLAALLAAAIIGVSLRPQSWPRPAEAQAGSVEGGAIVLEGEGLGAPAADPAQVIYVVRTVFGQAKSLRIAVLPNQGDPGPADKGVRILLAPATAAQFAGRAASLEISVRPLPVTTASRLAASVQGAGPTVWTVQPLSPQEQVLHYDLPAIDAPDAIGLRIESDNNDYNYGVEIVKIRIVPSGAAVQQSN